MYVYVYIYMYVCTNVSKFILILLLSFVNSKPFQQKSPTKMMFYCSIYFSIKLEEANIERGKHQQLL